MTNWRTISGSIARLRELEGVLDGDASGRTKKELLQLTREREKLELSLGGIKDMGSIPDLMFVIDTNKEAIAILEARKLNIPVVAILDTNSTRTASASRSPATTTPPASIQLYCDMIAARRARRPGGGASRHGSGPGAAEAPVEPSLRETPAFATPAEPEAKPPLPPPSRAKPKAKAKARRCCAGSVKRQAEAIAAPAERTPLRLKRDAARPTADAAPVEAEAEAAPAKLKPRLPAEAETAEAEHLGCRPPKRSCRGRPAEAEPKRPAEAAEAEASRRKSPPRLSAGPRARLDYRRPGAPLQARPPTF